MTTSIDQWLLEAKKQSEVREKNIQLLKNSKPLDEDKLRKMDSSLKKVTAFTKKLKTIGSQTVSQLLPELDKLNLSKYLDEIAANICEAKLKTSDLGAMIEFCTKISCLYREFPSQLVAQFRKQMPNKKSDQITNPSKLRVDLRFFSELLLNGLFEKDGLQLLGAVLAYLVQTDKQEHVNVSLLLPFCRFALFPITGIVPFSIAQQTTDLKQIPKEELLSKVFIDDQRTVVAKLLNDYWDSLVTHANQTRMQMNKLCKSIKRQERTRGDASADDRNQFDTVKTLFERLLQNSMELSECLGRQVPEMPEEPSDDEREEAAARKLNAELSEGRVQLWPDRDSQLFYESLVDATPFMPMSSDSHAQQAEKSPANVVTSTQQQPPQKMERQLNESIDNVDLSCLHEQQVENDEKADVVSEHDENEAVDEEQEQTAEYQDTLRQRHSSSPTMQFSTDVKHMNTVNLHELLERMPNCINRELIDATAVDFLKHYARNKAHRKRLIQHLLQAPVDRLELLPFYARFIATVRPAYPDMAMQILQELLKRFNKACHKNTEEAPKKADETQKPQMRIDSKIHTCTFLAELCKFGILPKAEALTCLRQLLVQMRGQKVDMLCVFIESMGAYLYRSPDAHAKMSVIMQVLKDKSTNVKDARQKILLENAYFAVIPPDEQTLASAALTAPPRLPPMYEFVQLQLATEIRVSTFRRLNWDDRDLADFTLRLLSNSQRVHFEDLAKLASLVSALTDYHDWIGVRILDDVLEFIRLSLEMNTARLQQRTVSSVAYLGQLFNYNVCNTTTLFKILYQLITFGIPPPTDGSPDHLVVHLQRIRLAIHLIDTVCEFFVSGKSKRRMDHFLLFFFKFYHETREAWSAHVEEIDEFPEDVEFELEDLLNTWRKGEQFPRNLLEALMKVAEVEEFYKTKVEEVLANMRSVAADNDIDEDGKRRLNLIMEEDEEDEGSDEEEDEDDEEDEEEEENDEHEQHRQPHRQSEETDDGATETDNDADEEDERICVHTKVQQQPEDEDFMRDFDRMMAESLQTAPATLQGPMSDLVVPPLVRQKFERKLKFADSESVSIDKPPGDGLLPIGRTSPLTTQQHQAPRMALMLRGAGFAKGGGGGSAMTKTGGVQLKAVHIAETANLYEKWKQAQEQREHDRREMKKVTLAMNERMTAEADVEYQQQQVAAMASKFQFTQQSSFSSSNTQ